MKKLLLLSEIFAKMGNDELIAFAQELSADTYPLHGKVRAVVKQYLPEGTDFSLIHAVSLGAPLALELSKRLQYFKPLK